MDDGDITRQRVLFFGAGQANIGAAELFVRALQRRGVNEAEARKRVWLFDSKGLVTKSRASQLSEDKLQFAQDAEDTGDLATAIARIKPTALVGAAAVAGAFTKEVVSEMSRINKEPIIFALSNPTSKAECTAAQAYEWSQGRAIFASGTRFAPVEYKPGVTFAPGFANNAFIFPAIALGTIVSNAAEVTPEMFLNAAEALAESVDSKLFASGAVYPPVERIARSAVDVAAAVAFGVDPSSSRDKWRQRVSDYITANDLYRTL
jgi:malate dehydrogenase (oxaloacetate-decarboxylating)(NADP+)